MFDLEIYFIIIIIISYKNKPGRGYNSNDFFKSIFLISPNNYS